MKKFEFKRISAQDLPLLKTYLYAEPGRLCDYTVGALYMWTEYFDNQFCITDDTLIIKQNDVSGDSSYNVPIGPAQAEVLAALRTIAKQEHACALKMYPLSESEALEAAAQLEGATLKSVQDWFDYVYVADDLINLPGKKYHGQKNHINKYMRSNPDFRLCDITGENVPAIIEFLKNNFETEIPLSESIATKNLAAYENVKVIEVLRDFEKLGFEGKVLCSGNEIHAFAIGELKGDTLFVHVEKAAKDVSGAYPMINREFAAFCKQKYPHIEYINREEDVGIPGLRKAKESYHPVFKLQKFELTLPMCEDADHRHEMTDYKNVLTESNSATK